MITVIMRRDNSGRKSSSMRTESVAKALEMFLVYEVGFGGRITEITKTKVTVVTRAMECIDTTTFEGAEEDMQLLVEGAVVSVQAYANKEVADKVLDYVVKISGGLPLMLKLVGSLFAGRITLALIMTAMIGSDTLAKEFAQLPQKNLFTALCLVRIDKAQPEEALALAHSEPVYAKSGKIEGLTNNKEAV